MTITSEMIKQLREQTGAGMMDCKRALEATNGSMEAAVEYLRKKGAAIGQKRADRVAKEGVIVTRVSADGNIGVILEVNCETDFVGRSADFIEFAGTVAGIIERHRPAGLETLMGLSDGGKTVLEHLNGILSKVGEKVEIRRFSVLESKDGVVCAYTHVGNKIGVLVELSGLTTDSVDATVGRDVAMQVAAMSPMVITREEVQKSIIDREMDIYRTQARNEGKPAQIADKIAMGRLEKFYQEICLLEQVFIKDSGRTVKEYLQEAATRLGRDVTVRRFRRYHLGGEQAG